MPLNLHPLSVFLALFSATAAFPSTNISERAGERTGDVPASTVAPTVLASITSHSIQLEGKLLKYHVTAGYLVLNEEEGKPLLQTGANIAPAGASSASKQSDAAASKDSLTPKAKMFFVAYTLDGVTDPASRPLTFAFNGGPGSSSIWLHMASIGPKRAVLTDLGEAPPPPYRLVDNEGTWLDATDLVFIDPVSTGYSRPAPKEDPKQFHGLREDIASVAEFIRLYTTRHQRWLSPKFVLGESYGSTRAAGLVEHLQTRHGLYLNGVILVSSALSFQGLDFFPQNEDPYTAFLPTYTATAWYHQRLSPDLQSKDIATVTAEAREFADNEYAAALRRGSALRPDELRVLAEKLHRLTSLSIDEILLHRLRIKDHVFIAGLLRSEVRAIGRFDSRFTGQPYNPGNYDPLTEYDPSAEAVNGPLTATFNDYVRRDLAYENDLPYETIADVWPWKFGDYSVGPPNTGEDLRKAMIRHPYLKVWITCGYYDLATPFHGSELTISSLNLPPEFRANIQFTYYESGHMHYIHRPSREKFRRDYLAFLRQAVEQTPVSAARRVTTSAANASPQ